MVVIAITLRVVVVIVMVVVAVVVVAVGDGGVGGLGVVVVVGLVSVVGRALVVAVIVSVRVRILQGPELLLQVLDFSPQGPDVPPDRDLLAGRQLGEALLDLVRNGLDHLLMYRLDYIIKGG